MKRFLLAALLAVGLASKSAAVCTAVGTAPVILIPSFSDSGSVWSACLRYDFQVISSSGMFNGISSVIEAQKIYVQQIAGWQGGVWISSPTTVSSSMTITGANGLGVTYGIAPGSITVSGAKGYIIGASSITTSGSFFGGAETLTGPLTVTGANSYVTAASSVIVSGLLEATRMNVGTLANNATLDVSHVDTTANSNTSFWNLTYGGGLYLENPTTTINALTGIGFGGGANNNSLAGIAMVQEVANSKGAFAIFTGGSGVSSTVPERVRVDSAGNVGVGTATPGTTLDVNGAATVRAQATVVSSITVVSGVADSYQVQTNSGRAYNSTGYGGVLLASNDAAANQLQGSILLHTDAATTKRGIQLYSYDSNAAAFGTVSVPFGSFGIGTTTPGSTLDVNGSAQFGSGVAKSSFSTGGTLTFPNNVGINATNTSGNPYSAFQVTSGNILRIQTDTVGNAVTIGSNPNVYLTINSGSVTANGAFFGDGSHLSGISGGHILSTGSMTGGVSPFTQRSSMTFDQAYFSLTDNSSTGFTFVSLSSNVAGVAVSSNSIGFAGSGTNTTYTTCASSVAFNTTGGKDIEISFNSSIYSNDGTNRNFCANVTQNGNWIGGYNATKSMACDERVTSGSNHGAQLHASILVPASSAPAAGLNTWCLMFKVNTGTYLYPNASAFAANEDDKTSFGVREISGGVTIGTGEQNTYTSSKTFTNALSVANGTFTVAMNGMYTAGSQARAILTSPSGVQKPSIWLPIYWATAGTNKQNLYLASSSATLTVPVGGAGAWLFEARAQVPLEGSGGHINRIGLSSDGATCSNTMEGPLLYYSVANTPLDMRIYWIGELADGATVTVCMYHDNVANVSLDPNSYQTYFKGYKLY